MRACACARAHTDTHINTHTHTHIRNVYLLGLGGLGDAVLGEVKGVVTRVDDVVVAQTDDALLRNLLQHASAHVSIRQQTSAYDG